MTVAVPITVVIPTRERGDVLPHALRTVIAQDYPDLEILVSDNFSSDATRDVVAGFGDPRIRYVNTGRRVSMSRNWEFAFSQITDDERFVLIIGDDDGLIPGALDQLAALVRETEVDAISATFATFIWPNPTNDHAGRLLVPMRTGHEVRESTHWLRRAVGGRAWYAELPMIYAAGAVRMKLLRRIQKAMGDRIVGSCQPDVFTSTALASIAGRYAFSHRPLTIAGHSKHSNGAAWAATRTAGPDKAATQANAMFMSEPNIPWHPDLPTLDNGNLPMANDLLVYESYLQGAPVNHNLLGLNHQAELALLMARRIGDQTAMDIWLDRFATRHGLDVAMARRQAARLRPRLRMAKAVEYFQAFRDIYRLEPRAGMVLRDVYEASVVAATILSTRPSRLRSQWGTLRKWSGKLTGAGR